MNARETEVMNSGHHRQLVELFHAALDLNSNEQRELIRRVSADSVDLGARLSALLDGDRAPLDYRLQVASAARNCSSSRGSRAPIRLSGSTCRDIATRSTLPLSIRAMGVDRPPRSTHGSAPTPSVSLPMEPRAGMMVHRYQLIRELGRGGMGVVFLARDTRLGRLAAIKFLGLSHPDLIQRFIAEARATALCHHDNIVIVYDADEYRGMPYMALEYLEGQTLRQLMNEKRAVAQENHRVEPHACLSAERAVSIAIPVLSALQRAHDMGIVHRDLKPENVMFTNAGKVKVLDFGIAKVLAGQPAEREPEAERARALSDEDIASHDLRGSPIDASPSMTRTGVLVGTLPYMSPEQLRGQATDARADIWAFGVMLFEMVTGQHPLGALTRAKLATVADERHPMPRLSALRPELGPLAEIIDRCLCKPRRERTMAASELLSALESSRNPQCPPVASLAEGPFHGLAAFQEADANRFFGRSSDVAAAVARVRHHPMVAIVGPSGVGKSSLVRAGVIPALKRSGEGWTARIVRPGRTPLSALSSLLAEMPGASADEPPVDNRPTSDERSPGRRELEARLIGEPGYLGAQLRAWAQRASRRVLIFVDQFEELFTLDVEPAERSAFLACLLGVADDASSPLRIVFAMRSDFIERIAETLEFMAVATRGLMLLPPMGRARLREALVRPALAAHYQFESETIVESMLDDLDNTGGALPLLQFTAAQLWANRDRQRRLITEDSYRAIGGIAGALARHANAVLVGMSSQRVRLTRRIFERLVTPERTRALVRVGELRELADGTDGTSAEELEQVLQALVDARLVVIETGDDDSGGLVEVVHESLIASWPTLNRWLDENRDDAVFVGRLRTAAAQWSQSGEAPGMLWRGNIECEARAWYGRYQGSLSERERRFLDAAFTLANRTQRRVRALVIGVIAALTAMVLAALAGMWSIRQAEREATRQAAIAQLQMDELGREQAAKELALKHAEAATSEARRSREEMHAALAPVSRARRRADRDKDLIEATLADARAAKRLALRMADKKTEASKRLERALAKERERLERLLGP